MHRKCLWSLLLHDSHSSDLYLLTSIQHHGTGAWTGVQSEVGKESYFIHVQHLSCSKSHDHFLHRQWQVTDRWSTNTKDKQFQWHVSGSLHSLPFYTSVYFSCKKLLDLWGNLYLGFCSSGALLLTALQTRGQFCIKSASHKSPNFTKVYKC